MKEEFIDKATEVAVQGYSFDLDNHSRKVTAKKSNGSISSSYDLSTARHWSRAFAAKWSASPLTLFWQP
jgi:hypothetical protein